MNLTYRNFEGPLVITEDIPYKIVIEAPELMRQCIEDINVSLSLSDAGFMLFDDNKMLNFSKSVDFIFNPFSIELSQKKIMTKILQQICENAVEGDFFQKTQKIKSEINKYIYELLATVDIPLTFDYDFQLSKFFSAVGISIDQEIGLLARLLQYVDLCNSILGIRVFIFYGLSNIFTEEELKQFSKETSYKKIYVVMLENSVRDWFGNEKIIVLDKDLCIVKWKN
ncbi:type II-A CRISPR-associated protein Csn2 [Anaerovibrio sp.]|uniref:type II-A CRISPR-associated protein Csn2 n=1 Tax=Anaerovibrio sp. TaxID=1872532 RepID=UPI00388EB7B4